MNKTTMLLPLLLIAQSASAAPGEPYSDEWIEGRVSGAFAYNSGLDSSDISVDSNGGAVVLKGSVPTMVERDFAETVAKATDGVTAVNNQLTVDENLKLKTRSSFSQKVQDAAITAAVKTKLLTHRDTHGMAVNVDTQGNVVSLSGVVKSDKERKLSEQLAYATSGVRQVKNNLTIGATSEADQNASRARMGESKDMATAVTDGWISTQVRSSLTFSNDYPGSDVRVSTTNGIVTLEGFARNAQQKSLIENEVAEIVGVKSVNNKLEITNVIAR